ncbi:MAG: hypothetical protein JW753_06060 [Dehalococcoidia bacterium]|nr:hypothetical protein [Dehalococcoidia bacterium]
MPSAPTSPEQPRTIPVDELKRNFQEKAVEHMLQLRNLGEFQIPDGF